MSVRYRSHSLALYGEEPEHYFVRDEDCGSEEYDLDSECGGDRGGGGGGTGLRSSIAMEILGLQREQQVYFSNQEYYRRLEDLKSTHLRNMAELERMYISQGNKRCMEGDDGRLGRKNSTDGQSVSVPNRRLQRINSQEELDFNETSSGSDRSELSGDDNFREMVLDHFVSPGLKRTFGRDRLLSPEEMMTQKQLRFQKAPCPKAQGRCQTRIGVKSRSKVTMPKPFQMMLREEERKRQRVRTRSEIELENTLLRRELEELRECQKKFRASPAPAHIHLPLYDIISRSSTQRLNPRNRNSKRSDASAASTPPPFNFLERERKKKELKIMEELAKVGQKEEQRVFKARPFPGSVYGTRQRADTKTAGHQTLPIGPRQREAAEVQRDPSPQSCHLEPDTVVKPDSVRPQGSQSSKGVTKQIELSIEMVKEGGRSCVHPLKARNICSPAPPGDREPLVTDCSSV